MTTCTYVQTGCVIKAKMICADLLQRVSPNVLLLISIEVMLMSEAVSCHALKTHLGTITFVYLLTQTSVLLFLSPSSKPHSKHTITRASIYSLACFSPKLPIRYVFRTSKIYETFFLWNVLKTLYKFVCLKIFYFSLILITQTVEYMKIHECLLYLWTTMIQLQQVLYDKLSRVCLKSDKKIGQALTHVVNPG